MAYGRYSQEKSMEEMKFEFAGHEATVLIPDNPNGRWIWKTEFFDAFEHERVAQIIAIALAAHQFQIGRFH